MKAVAGKILGMRRQLAASDGENVEDRNFVTLRDLFKSLIETLDLSLVPGTQRGRNAWRTRDVGNVRHNDHGLSLLFQRTQDLVVVLCKLLDRQTMTDVVDADPNSHEIGRLLNTWLQL